MSIDKFCAPLVPLQDIKIVLFIDSDYVYHYYVYLTIVSNKIRRYKLVTQ